MTSFKLALRGAALTGALLGSSAAFGQRMSRPMMLGSGSHEPYRMFTISMPVITMARDTVMRMELNLAGKASLALEGMMQGKHEELDDKERKESGESLIDEGKGAALFIARYTNPMSMTGFYWGLGLGYREETVQWRVKPSDKDKDVNMALLDENDMLNHNAEMKGVTGHARAGYRYAGTDIPLLIGGYLGVRHFQPGAKDAKAKDGGDDEVAYVAMTDREKDKLKKKYETTPEVGVEVGVTF
jgi:hypothetical protein